MPATGGGSAGDRGAYAPLSPGIAGASAGGAVRRARRSFLLCYVLIPISLLALLWLAFSPESPAEALYGSTAASNSKDSANSNGFFDFLSKNVWHKDPPAAGELDLGGEEYEASSGAGTSKTQPAAGPKGKQTIHRRVVAVADLHGDLDHAHAVLRMAGLLSGPPKHSWIGGDSILVSTGDIVDRGDDTIALYRLFDRLRNEAAAAGGEVRNCLGNHELMNALGDWRYVTRGDIASFGGAAPRREVMSADGWIGKTWLAHYNISHTVDLLPRDKLPGTSHWSNSTDGSGGGRVRAYAPPAASFVHGGITPYWASQGLAQINTIGRSFLERALSDKHPTGHQPASTPPLESALYSETGPLWYRGYATDEDEATICGQAGEVLDKLSSSGSQPGGDGLRREVRHLVMGHTPHLDGFVVRCPQQQIMLIDTGISRAYGGEQSALVIETSLDAVGGGTGDGVSTKYSEETTLTALYKGRKPKIVSRQSREVYIY